MTPNACKPRQVFAVIIPAGDTGPNERFRLELGAACQQAKVPLTLLDDSELPRFECNQDDRWIQDEIEFGYVASPAKIADVVVDGPRNRGLDTIGTSEQLGSNIGSVLLDAEVSKLQFSALARNYACGIAGSSATTFATYSVGEVPRSLVALKPAAASALQCVSAQHKTFV